MSAIAATYALDGRPATPAPIEEMLAAMSYRALDGTSVFPGDRVAMGVAKMVITPEEGREDQPLISARTGCVLVSDARLDDRRTLMSLLGIDPKSEPTDAELILLAYERWGLDALSRLLGDFAFVLWDPRRLQLICARDTSGQRALFYVLSAGVFYVASEIHPLLRVTGIPVEPNEERIRNFLTPFEMFANEKQYEDTFYKGVYSVEAGSALVVKPSSLVKTRYWNLGPLREVRYKREEEYAEHFLEVFSSCVGDRLRSVGPVGVLLSGGLDSSSIACTALYMAHTGRVPINDKLLGFTSTFEGLSCDERDYVETIRDFWGFDVRFVASDSYAGRLELEPEGFREAPNIGIAGAKNSLYNQIVASGARLLLSGQCGDNIILGSHLVFDSLLRKGQLRELLSRMSFYHKVSHDPWRRILLLHTLLPLTPLWLQRRLLARYVRRQYLRRWDRIMPDWFTPWIREDILSRSMARAVGANMTRKFSNTAREEEYRLLYPPEVARFPSPWPVEHARPFADRRLHEYLLAIPPEVKYKPHPDTEEFYAGAKRVLREAMKGIMPETIRTRTSKTMFEDVLTSELASSWHLYEQAFGPGAKPRIAEKGYVDRQSFWEALMALREGKRRADVVYLTQVVGLETWLRSLEQPQNQLLSVGPCNHLMGVQT